MLQVKAKSDEDSEEFIPNLPKWDGSVIPRFPLTVRQVTTLAHRWPHSFPSVSLPLDHVAHAVLYSWHPISKLLPRNTPFQLEQHPFQPPTWIHGVTNGRPAQLAHDSSQNQDHPRLRIQTSSPPTLDPTCIPMTAQEAAFRSKIRSGVIVQAHSTHSVYGRCRLPINMLLALI